MQRKTLLNRALAALSGAALIMVAVLVIGLLANGEILIDGQIDAAESIGGSASSAATQLGDGTTALDGDEDGNGLPDQWERAHGLNVSGKTSAQAVTGDPDGDGLNNIDEYYNDSHPGKTDTDEDGMPDLWEIENNLDPADASGDHGNAGDFDGDGVSNGDEYDDGTDPSSSDTNQDGIPDGVERDARRAQSGDGTVETEAPDGEPHDGEPHDPAHPGAPTAIPSAEEHRLLLPMITSP